MIALVLSFLFFGILFFFGWQVAQYSLKENRIEYLIGLSGIFGIGLYLIFVNALGFFIPIKIVFYLVLLLFFILGLGLFYFNRQESLRWEIDRKWRKILLGTALFLVVTGGMIALRLPFELDGQHAPTAATIAEGNFPPIEIWEPEYPLNYHYALELFDAAIYKVTGLPLYLAVDFRVALLVGILFLLGFILIKRFCNDNFKAFISSLLMLYAGTLSFLKGVKGIPILYNLYIRHQGISAPFKFVGDAIDSKFFSNPAITEMIGGTGAGWPILAFPLTIAIIYLYFYLVDQKLSNRAGKIIFLLCGLLLALLALAAETCFAVLSLILFIYPFAFGFIKKDWHKAKEFLFVSFLILLIASPVAILQGGVLKSVISHGPLTTYDISVYEMFKINKTPWLLQDVPISYPIYHPEFLMIWGWLLILLIPALIFLFKKYFQLGLFLTPFLITSFFTPFFINLTDLTNLTYLGHGGVLLRFFSPIPLLGGLTMGLFLGSLYLSFKKTALKRAVIFITIVLMVQGLFFQLFYLFVGSPPGIWNPDAKLYAKPNSFEGTAFSWVKENTTIKDYFLIIKNYEGIDEEKVPNYRFILNTGRMAPIYVMTSYRAGSFLSRPEPDLFKEVRKNCNPSAIKKLKYSYLYVNEEWLPGMEEKCLANNDLELKFRAGEGDKFVRIYKNLALPEP